MTDKNIWKQQGFEISSFHVFQPGMVTDENVRRYAEANFTLVEGNTPIEHRSKDFSHEEAIRLLDLCEKYGLKYVHTDHSLFTGKSPSKDDDLQQVIDKYSDYPAFEGYYLWDEPGRESFKTVKNTMNYFYSKDPSKLCLIAMLPSYGPYRHPEYEDFIQDYVDTVNPQVLSFDYYPFREKDDLDGLFQDLEVNRKIACKKGIPLWLYIQACEWGIMRNPSVDMIRFQAFCGIAYGIKGLQYFVYRGLAGESNFEFRNAIVSSDMKPTSKYTGVSDLNSEILNIGPVLMDLTSAGVFHSEPIPKFCNNITDSKTISCASNNLLFGFFQDQAGTNFVMVVNKDYVQSREIEIKLSEKRLVQEVKKSTGSLKDIGDSSVLKLYLKPGDGKLLKLNSGMIRKSKLKTES